MEVVVKVKCPVCGWKGEIKKGEEPECPKCFCQVIAVKAVAK